MDQEDQGTREKFLFEEYRAWTDALNRSEQIGEGRLRFFLTFSTAVLGGVGALARDGDGNIQMARAVPLLGWVMPALLLLGLVTFLRMLRRNETTDEYKVRLARVRLALGQADESDRKVAIEGKMRSRRLRDGGLAVVMLALLALLAGVWGALPSSGATEFRRTEGLLAFAGTAGVLYVYMKVRDRDRSFDRKRSERKGPS